MLPGDVGVKKRCVGGMFGCGRKAEGACLGECLRRLPCVWASHEWKRRVRKHAGHSGKSARRVKMVNDDHRQEDAPGRQGDGVSESRGADPGASFHIAACDYRGRMLRKCDRGAKRCEERGAGRRELCGGGPRGEGVRVHKHAGHSGGGESARRVKMVRGRPSYRQEDAPGRQGYGVSESRGADPGASFLLTRATLPLGCCGSMT